MENVKGICGNTSMASFTPSPKDPPSQVLKRQKRESGGLMPIEQASVSSSEAYVGLHLKACFDPFEPMASVISYDQE